MVAPAAVFFGAVPGAGFKLSNPPVGTPYEPDKHEITYIWTVRNALLSFERAPHLNMPEAWKNANVYYGPEAAIVFNDAGTYDIDLWAVDRFGNVGQSSTQVLIANANARFSGNDTICYSETDFNGAPSGGTQVRSFAALQTAIANKSGSDIRILFRAGNDFRNAITSQIDVHKNNITAFGSFGNGNKPVLPLMKQAASPAAALFGIPRDEGETKVYDLDLRGGWQATRERGYQGASPIWRDTNTDVLFHRCRLSGHNALNSQNRAGDCFFVWSDGEVTNWQNFGLYGFVNRGGVKRFAIIGSDLHQHEDARQGMEGDRNLSNAHGPVRIEDNDNLYLHVVDMFTRNGWSPGSGGTADQPCIRINSSGAANARTIADRCSFEGGYQIIKIRGQDVGTATPDVPGNHIFDKILTIGTPETQWHVDCTFGGCTFRNVYAFEANVPKYSQGIGQGMFVFGEDDTVIPSNLDTPVSIYSSTFVSLLSSTNQRAVNTSAQASIPGVFHVGNFNNFTAENNIEYMPNQNSPSIADPVDITTPITGGRFGAPVVTPRFKGSAESVAAIEVTGDGSSTLTLSYSQLVDPSGNATNQSYWQSREAAGSTMHFLLAPNYAFMHAELGEINVAFNASNVTVTNTAGTFGNGARVYVKLDQSDKLPGANQTHDITGQTVPAAALLGAANAGGEFVATDRFDTSPRPGGDMPGAANGTPQMGTF